MPAMSRFVDSGDRRGVLRPRGPPDRGQPAGAAGAHRPAARLHRARRRRATSCPRCRPTRWTSTGAASPTPTRSQQVVDLLGRATAKIHCASDEDSDQDLVDFQVEEAIAGSRRGRREELIAWVSRLRDRLRRPGPRATTPSSSTRSARAGSASPRPERALGAATPPPTGRRAGAPARGTPRGRTPRRPHGVTASTRSSGTTATLEPPNPPPVIRARDRPGLDRHRDGDVELGAGDLEVVAHRDVRRGEQPPDLGPVAARQRVDGRARPGSISVTTWRGPAADPVVGRAPSTPSRSACRRRHAERRGRRLAVGATGAVPAVDQRVRDAGVGDQQRRARPRPAAPASPRRRQSKSISSAVPASAEHRDRLVHAAGRRADDLGLGADARRRPARAAGLGRAASPSSAGHAPPRPRTPGPPSSTAQRPAAPVLSTSRSSPGRRGRPRAAPTPRPAAYAAQPSTVPGRLADRALPGRRAAGAGDPDHVVGARRAAAYVACGSATGRHQPAVVVGVLADQVDPAGRAADGRRRLRRSGPRTRRAPSRPARAGSPGSTRVTPPP